MLPEDERHGTEAGHEQHNRDGETPCPDCYQAKILAARRRTKRRTMGYLYRLPLGDANHTKLIEARRRGHTYDSIADLLDLSASVTWRLCNNGPAGIVSARTWRTVSEARLPTPVTRTGITRRLQALTWLGYSTVAIAEVAGVCKDTIMDALTEPRTLMTHRVMADIARAYDSLSMVPAAPTRQQARAGATRARNLARRNGWSPPLAWDDDTIDVITEYVPNDPQAESPKDYIDPVVIERILAGDTNLNASIAEKREVVRRWTGTHNELARSTGWKVERYLEPKDGAA